jgi:chromosome segregation ATPase
MSAKELQMSDEEYVNALRTDMHNLRNTCVELQQANARQANELTSKDAEIMRLKNELRDAKENSIPLKTLEQAFERAIKNYEERVSKHNGTTTP